MQYVNIVAAVKHYVNSVYLFCFVPMVVPCCNEKEYLLLSFVEEKEEEPET